MSRSRSQVRINKGGLQGSQRDLFGNEVHVLNAKEVYRMVKCGRCKRTVKSSQAKTHLSYGKSLTICKECLELEDKERRIGTVVGTNIRHISDVTTGVGTITADIPSAIVIN